MSIELNMYQGHMMTAKDDAVVYEPMIGGNGILYGCELTHLGANQIHISAGDGVIKGRKFTVLEETINVQLPEEDGMPGRIYIQMDLADSSEPIKIISVCSGSVLPALEQDESCNHDNGIYEIELATYTGNRAAITNLKTTYTNISGRMTQIQESITDLKKSVADGKALIASALTKAGATTASDATFQTMANNVANARPKQTVWTSSGVNMQSYFPSTWQKLRTSDFICGFQSAGAKQDSGSIDTTSMIRGGSATASCTYSYNNSTGILTFSASTGTWKTYGNVNQGGPGGSVWGNSIFCAWKGTYSG